jgi:hypothetical protein
MFASDELLESADAERRASGASEATAVIRLQKTARTAARDAGEPSLICT